MRYREFFRKVCLLYLVFFSIQIANAAEVMNLGEMLSFTYQTNNEIKFAREELGKAEASKMEAYTGFAPSIVFSHEKSKGKLEGNIAKDVTWSKKKSEENKLELQQNLFEGGKTLFSVKSAHYNYLAQSATYQSVLNKIFYDAVEAYENVMMYRDMLQFAIDGQESFAKHLELANIRLKMGEATKTEISQAEVRLSQSHASVALHRGELLAAEANFERISGIKPANTLRPISLEGIAPMPRKFTQFINIVEANNCDIKIQENQLEAARQGIKISMSEFSPKVSLSAGLGK